MHNSLRLLAICACAGLAVACQKPDSGSPAGKSAVSLDSEASKFGYAIGIDLGNSLMPVADSVDLEALKLGIDDAAKANQKIAKAQADLAAKPEDPALQQAAAEAMQMPDLKLDAAAREEVKNRVSQKLQQQQQEERDEAASAASEAGKKFLAENGKREGVTTTESGLQYEVLSEGEGEPPAKTDEVTVHYTGSLITGEVFDSSVERGQPVSFPLGNVIEGWTEGVQLMKPGAKYKFYIPSELGYGERGAGAKIGPNETLVFEVELIEVKRNK